VLVIPDKPVALLVVLHGDDAGAATTVADWRRAAERAHVALLAPECPKDRGCASGSWWRWWLSDAHDPAWLDAQIAAAAAAARVDRVVVAGYSGGASYLGGWAPPRAAQLGRVAFVSGGYRFTDVCPTSPFAALFFIGRDDESIPIYVRPLATWLGTCERASVTWQLLDGVGHLEMHDALRAGRAREVIDWLLAR
jgi:poly(3-hydroxybutyrate) depolymerase